MARVLVVEDDFEAREAIAARLREAHHRVVTAHDATAALTMVKQIGSPDVYVVDVGLPSMDGFEFVRRATGSQPPVPTIYMTGRAMPPRPQPQDAPASTFLVKPFAASQLLDTIQAILDRKVADGGTIEPGW